MIDVRPIDANALKSLLIEVLERIKESPKMTRDEMHIISGCHMLCEMIDDAHTIDAVEVVHGRWDKPVEHGLPYAANHLGVVCSYCCKWSDNDYNYCPNCGAMMDGGASDGSD